MNKNEFNGEAITLLSDAVVPSNEPDRPASPEPPTSCVALTDIAFPHLRVRRPLHSLAYSDPLRFGWRALEVVSEVACAYMRHMLVSSYSKKSNLVSIENGAAPPLTLGRRVALYAHFSQRGFISSMVLAQLATYRAAGYDVIFVSNSDVPWHEPAWTQASLHCWKMIRRRNVGFDFGAWRDAAAMLRNEAQQPTELLLVNDSVTGPIRDMHTIFSTARQLPEGIVGLTESHQGGVHLQSYFIIARGRRATADILSFLVGSALYSSKWLLVKQGEFGLTRHALRRGHRVCALYGYGRVLDVLLSLPQPREQIAALSPALTRCAKTPSELRRTLLNWPVNPTHHLWHGLVTIMNFPFIKTSLIRDNPGGILGVDQWASLIPEDAICSAGEVQDHLTCAALEKV